jgi:hypothetical protein
MSWVSADDLQHAMRVRLGLHRAMRGRINSEFPSIGGASSPRAVPRTSGVFRPCKVSSQR